jgi:hypothetical protein
MRRDSVFISLQRARELPLVQALRKCHVILLILCCCNNVTQSCCCSGATETSRDLDFVQALQKCHTFLICPGIAEVTHDFIWLGHCS